MDAAFYQTLGGQPRKRSRIRGEMAEQQKKS